MCGSCAAMTDAFQEAIRAIYAASKPRTALWEYYTPQVITKLAHALPRTRGKPCGIRQLIRQRYCGVMTAMPKAACIIPTTRAAWQKWWARLQGTA